MATLIAPLLWVAALACSATAFHLAFADDAAHGRLAAVAGALVAGWVALGISLATLAVAGAALTPAAAVLPAVLALLLATRRRRVRRTARRRGPGIGIGAGALFALAAVRLLWHLVQWPWARPWSWDVYAVWGFKARFLAATGGLWRYLGVAHLYPFSNGDYPPLLPAHLAAASWPAADGTGAAVVEAAIGLAAVALLVAAWRRLGDGVTAAGAAALLVWPTALWGAAAVGLADLPLALLAGIATTIVAARRTVLGPAFLPLVLCGLGLVKNEGLTFALLLAVAALATRQLRPVAAVAAIGPGVAWHVAVAGAGVVSDRLAAFAVPAHPLDALFRLAGAAGRLASGPDLLAPLCAALLGVLLAFAVPTARAAAAAVAGQAVALAVFTAFTPYGLEWQLATSLPRSLAQILPAALALFVVAAGELSAAAPDTPTETAGTARAARPD